MSVYKGATLAAHPSANREPILSKKQQAVGQEFELIDRSRR